MTSWQIASYVSLIMQITPPFYYCPRYPLSYIFNGSYWWANGTLGNQATAGNWHSAMTANSAEAYALFISSNGLDAQSVYNKELGRSLR